MRTGTSSSGHDGSESRAGASAASHRAPRCQAQREAQGPVAELVGVPAFRPPTLRSGQLGAVAVPHACVRANGHVSDRLQAKALRQAASGHTAHNGGTSPGSHSPVARSSLNPIPQGSMQLRATQRAASAPPCKPCCRHCSGVTASQLAESPRKQHRNGHDFPAKNRAEPQ